MDNIIQKKCLHLQHNKYDSYAALKFVVDLFVSDIYPFMKSLVQDFYSYKRERLEESSSRTRKVFLLCSDQMKKCFSNFLDILKIENNKRICIQESRQFIIERISWCSQKLLTVEDQIKSALNLDHSVNNEHSTDSIILDGMYFVNWVDHTFEILSKLSSIVYKTNKENPELENKKDEILDCVRGLHTSIDELLLSAMTLCRYCLPPDQLVIKARCQVVLRETKLLLGDLINGDLDSVVQVTRENLKLPYMPFNVNVLIDVLKDVLYALETNTNTALLALVVHSFSYSVSPADMLRQHLDGSCTCVTDTSEETDEECTFVKAFDVYNERLMQISTFAMSCSCDEKRVLLLRSGLASLEALDPHLVPALVLSPTSHHSTVLVTIWHQEVRQIRDNVFLIVDPAAFIDKAKQMMYQTLLEIIKERRYDSDKCCAVVNVGCVVRDFFGVYRDREPDALEPHWPALLQLLGHLDKAQMECKIVNNVLCSDKDFRYDVKSKQIKVTIDQFIKRLQLLYTIVKRIYYILNPKDNDEEFYNEEPMDIQNNTYTLKTENQKTYIKTPKPTNNMTKSIFARTINIRSTPGKLPLAILTKHLKNKKDLSFSIKLDALCNMSDIKKTRESSILYHPNATTKSLRKAVLKKHLLAGRNDNEVKMLNGTDGDERDSLMDDNMSLQITDVLNQLNEITNCVPARRWCPFNSTAVDKGTQQNVSYQLTSDRAGNGISADLTRLSTMSQPSEVNTLERISDLELVESRLSNLKCGHIETSL